MYEEEEVYGEEGDNDLRHELEELRKLNVQMAKYLVDALNKVDKLKKKLGDLEAKAAQKNFDDIPF